MRLWTQLPSSGERARASQLSWLLLFCRGGSNPENQDPGVLTLFEAQDPDPNFRDFDEVRISVEIWIIFWTRISESQNLGVE